MDKQKVIITGATGMIGEGVLNECLNKKISGFKPHTLCLFSTINKR